MMSQLSTVGLATKLCGVLDMVWSESWLQDDGARCCLLVLAMKSGHLVLWKIAMPISEMYLIFVKFSCY